MHVWWKAAAFLLSGVLWSQATSAQDVILLYFHDRPPYFVTADDGTISGLTATPAANAFKAAGVPFVWVRLPTSRQFLNIQHNLEPACMVGAYRTAERERYAKFTKPIFRSKGSVAIAYRGLAIPDKAKLEEVLAHKGVRVLVKEMYSYGSQIDALLARFKPETVRTTNESLSMLKMLRMRQADLMFMTEEEASTLLAKADPAGDDLRIVHFSDLQQELERHIMCSKRVPDDVIARLNRAID